MSEIDNEDDHLGQRVAAAAESNDAVIAQSIIRGGDFIVFQQIDMDGGDMEEDSEGNFSVVLAEVDDETAVVCFSSKSSASNFASELADDLPAGRDLPAVFLDGDTLLDGLPADCGLLVNPGAETECYFPPGCFEAA